jgi:hypothetical protein
MMNLIHHHRAHIPNGLAVLAAFLLLAAGITGLDKESEEYSSSQEITVAAKAEVNNGDSLNDTVENKRRGLNFGLLLFRR